MGYLYMLVLCVLDDENLMDSSDDQAMKSLLLTHSNHHIQIFFVLLVIWLGRY